MLEIFTRAFLSKITIGTSPMVFYIYMKSPKRCEPPEKNKNSSHGKRYNEDIEKKKNEKQKVSENFNNLTTTTKFFTFIFGPASARFYKIGVAGNNWLVGWFVTQFSQKRL